MTNVKQELDQAKTHINNLLDVIKILIKFPVHERLQFAVYAVELSNDEFIAKLAGYHPPSKRRYGDITRRTLEFIEHNPGASLSDITKAVRGDQNSYSRNATQRILQALLKKKRVERTKFGHYKIS